MQHKWEEKTLKFFKVDGVTPITRTVWECSLCGDRCDVNPHKWLSQGDHPQKKRMFTSLFKNKIDRLTLCSKHGEVDGTD